MTVDGGRTNVARKWEIIQSGKQLTSTHSDGVINHVIGCDSVPHGSYCSYGGVPCWTLLSSGWVDKCCCIAKGEWTAGWWLSLWSIESTYAATRGQIKWTQDALNGTCRWSGWDGQGSRYSIRTSRSEALTVR